ncbi:MAG: sigma-70 family RNA polymerase sigma factor [Cypionkella sp.]
MRTSWSAFHLQFLTLCRRRSAEHLFGQMRARHPVLAEAPCIDALLERQHSTTSPAPQRHAVVRALAVEAQADGQSAHLAATILILALWPGLDAVRYRLWRDWPEERDDLADDILAHIAIGVRRLDLASVRQVAATLFMNTERDLRRAFLDRKYQRRIELPMFDSLQAAAAPLRDDDALDAGAWRSRMDPILGRDTSLFLRIIILGETQAEAALALGLSHDAARKRHQRAMKKLEALQNNLVDLSHSEPPIGL